MKQISAAQFKARCLALMDDVKATGETILITKRGEPVAELHPARARVVGFLGRLRGKVQLKGELSGPAVPPQDWEQD
ncbi:MAG: type II toxin-antitoxin system Phd/YefM family antitoxin [Acidobacteria bacterium]|nr:type II toxin-antitoxin system Phd/YefM family antitoxin [Acidobacteriota bacterium]MBV9435959.1 type II toxin-antitoxin system Phd/YefM family antitoxin [Acidobacteriota bacterium]